MNSKLISYLKYIVILIISFGLLALAFRGISVKAILMEMSHAKLSWLLLSVIISLVAFASRAFRWQLLIESIGYTPSFTRTFYSLMIGYFANLAFPRLGEVTRCGTLSKSESIPFSSLFGTVIVERVVDVISLLACLLLAFIIAFKRIGDFLHDTIIHPLADKGKQLMASPLLIAILVVLFTILFFAIIHFWKKPEQNMTESKLARLMKGLVDGLRSISKLKRPWLFIFHSVFIWVLAYLGIYVCFFALSSTSQLDISSALVIMVVGGLGMAAPVQGGIGAFHLLVSEGLMLYGLSREDGLVYATLVHGLSLLVVVACGIISLLLLFSDNKKRNATDIKAT